MIHQALMAHNSENIEEENKHFSFIQRPKLSKNRQFGAADNT